MINLLKAGLIYRTELRPRESWSRGQILQFQATAVRKLLRFSVQSSPFYRRLYKGLDLERVPLAELPPVNKKLLMNNFDEVVTDPCLKLKDLHRFLKEDQRKALYLDRYIIKPTSGSTGEPGVFVYSRYCHTMFLAALLRLISMNRIKIRVPLRIAIIAGASAPQGRNRMMTGLRVPLLQIQTIPGDTNPKEIVLRLNHLQPHYLIAYPSLVSHLIQQQRSGHLDIDVRAIFSGGEVHSPSLTEEIACVWPAASFVEQYAFTEIGYAGGSCRDCGIMHLFEDLAIYEVLGASRTPVSAGETGECLLITNLYNYVFPLIRYEVSDMLTLDHGKNNCGRSWARVKTIVGRAEEKLSLKNNSGAEVKISPQILRETLWRVGDIEEYQLQPETGGIRILLVPSRTQDRNRLTHEVRQMIQTALAREGLGDVSISICIVDKIERVGGKLKSIDQSWHRGQFDI
jgi:phenylacetate-CoA ligase